MEFLPTLCFTVCKDYIHKFPVILLDNLQRESHKPYGPPPSVTWYQLLRKQTNPGTSSADSRNTLTYAHTTSRILQACGISLGSLRLLAFEAGDFVKLILPYVSMWIRSAVPKRKKARVVRFTVPKSTERNSGNGYVEWAWDKN